MSEWSRICCALDFSDTSRLAMARAAEMARHCGAQLTLLHVHQPPSQPTVELLAPARALEELATVDLARDLAVWRTEAERIATTAVRMALVEGDPAAEILRYARDHGVDLLVLGTHGRTGLRRLVLGSVAERVVRQAPCPVMVVRPKEPGAIEVDRWEVEQYQAV